ncbi:MAG: N-terminal acetyltransferase [Alyxoria varia]|nr:MAG: N-terminal acetyltransferase [Alyxoria varia]
MDIAAFTASEIQHYYDRIRLPEKHRHAPGPASKAIARDAGRTPTHSPGTSPSPALSYLTALQSYHKASIPFENLSLHYSETHSVSIEPDDLKRKILGLGDGSGSGGRGRGGYCTENNALFGMLLRSLGFEVYATGARVSSAMAMSEGGPKKQEEFRYSGWSHMLNIVTIGSVRYLVDVGFGANGPTRPVALSPSSATPMSRATPSVMRLIRAPIPEQGSSDHPHTNDTKSGNDDPYRSTSTFWIYQVKHSAESPDSEWLPAYCFPETPFIHADFKVMNFATSQGEDSWFRKEIVCVKFLLDEREEAEDEGRVVGELVMAQGQVKRRVEGKSETLCRFGTERERIEALGQYFGIVLTEEEKKGIDGSVAMLPME